jgi:amino acid transporter
VCYAELGTAIPLNGGAYVYLLHVYGPLQACLFTWTTIFILKPVTAAAVAIIFGEYAMRVIYGTLQPNESTAVWANKFAALFCLWVVIGINVMGTQWGARVNMIFMIIKVAAVSSVAVVALAAAG